MLRITSSGSFEQTTKFLKGLQKGKMFSNLDRYGRQGVDALSSATPIETGETAHSWGYQIGQKKDRISISWFNTHEEDGVNIAVIIQYGHGTGTGGYIQGRDYINPAMRPVFDRILDDVWRQVTNG
jgi:hypothetical protein